MPRILINNVAYNNRNSSSLLSEELIRGCSNAFASAFLWAESHCIRRGTFSL